MPSYKSPSISSNLFFEGISSLTSIFHYLYYDSRTTRTGRATGLGFPENRTVGLRSKILGEKVATISVSLEKAEECYLWYSKMTWPFLFLLFIDTKSHSKKCKKAQPSNTIPCSQSPFWESCPSSTYFSLYNFYHNHMYLYLSVPVTELWSFVLQKYSILETPEKIT